MASLGTIGGESLGPFAKIVAGFTGNNPEGDAVIALKAVTAIVSSVIGVMTVAAGIWFLFNFIIGGFNWVAAGGDKNSLESARKQITNAFIGLMIVVAGWSILALAGKFFGFDILLSHPEKIIKDLFPAGRIAPALEGI